MSSNDQATPRWDPEHQIYVGGVIPENAEVKSLIESNDGFLRLFGYGSLCWNPGTGSLAKPGVIGTLGRAIGYKRCWAQKSTDHRGRPPFPGIVCTLLEDKEVAELRKLTGDTAEGENVAANNEPTETEGIIYLIPPEQVDECLAELDFREKGGYARDVIEVIEDETGIAHKALLYRGTPYNPAFFQRALFDLPLAAAIMSVAEGPSGKNDFYLSSLDDFLTGTHTIAAENDDTTRLASMAREFQEKSQLYFLFGAGSNQHNQLLLNRPGNAACLSGEDAHEQKEIVVCTSRHDGGDKPRQLYAGGGHSAVLTESGKLYLWGWNENGQCGLTSEALQEESPVFPTTHALADVVVESASLGFSHTLVIEKDTNRLLAFGSNDRGQVTGKISSSQMSPVTPHFLEGVRVKAAAAGLFHSAVITEEGELVTFGCGRFGQSLTSTSDDGDVWIGKWKPPGDCTLVDVTCGRRHTVALDSMGRAWSFGENKYGQLGRPIEGKTNPKPSLVEGLPSVPPGGTLSVESGWSHTVVCIQSASGDWSYFGWGRNDKGQLGTGSTDAVLSARALFENKKLQEISCGSESTMALDADGNIWGCGWNEHGNLASGSQSDSLELTQTVGARVVAPPGQYTDTPTIAVGGAHFLAGKVSR